jgi:hypothetical protein
VLTALVVLALLGAAVGGASWLQHHRTTAIPGPVDASSPAARCTGTTVRVSAAPEIAPVIEAAARTLASAGQACGPVSVTAEEPAVTAAAAHKPDVWIPSSSVWLGGTTYKVKGKPMAYSPIVLAAPTRMSSLFVKDGRTSWAGLTDSAAKRVLPAVTVPDAEHSTVGLLSVYAEGRAMARTTADPGIAELRALTLRSRISDASVDPAGMMTRLAGETSTTDAAYAYGVFATTAQQVEAYQHAGHPVALTAAPPVDGLIDEDYPFAVAAKASDPKAISRLHSAITASLLTKAGFRTGPTVGALPTPADPAPLLATARQWSQYRSLSFQVLLLIDSSGSMNQTIKDVSGKTTTKAALLRASGVSAAELFGEDTNIGLWFFGTPTASSAPYVEAVPVGPIGSKVNGKTRRDLLTSEMASYTAPNNSGTPLYRTVLDGEHAMRGLARQGAVSLVIVLTDGDDKQSKYTMSQQDFLSKLTAGQTATNAVPIIAVGYGPDANMKALGAMATATGGKAFSAVNPADVGSAIAQAFLAAPTAS